MLRILALAALIVTVLSAIETAAYGGAVCPPPDSYAPCSCIIDYSEENSDVIQLNCVSKNLTDSEISGILDIFLATPGVSPLGRLDLEYNQLTRIPNQIQFFPQLVWINLQDNKIESIVSGAFNFISTVEYLSLNLNPLATISPGAFQGIIYW